MIEYVRNVIVYMLLGALSLFVIQQQLQVKSAATYKPPSVARSGAKGGRDARGPGDASESSDAAEEEGDGGPDEHEPPLLYGE